MKVAVAKPSEAPVVADIGGVQSPGGLPAISNIQAVMGPPMTDFRIFELCIGRAKNLLRIFEKAHGKKSKPERFLADAHRAAIVLAISALDAYIRTYVITKIREILANKHGSLPPGLAERIKSFLKDEGLLEAARNDDLLDRVEKAFKKDFEKKSFQGREVIAASMQLVGINDVFHEVAVIASKNEDTLKSDLDRFTTRRHIIAHRGDYDLEQVPPREMTVTKTDAEECIRLVSLIVTTIETMGNIK